MNLLQESLYYLTSGLLVPCIVFLLFMLVQSMVAVGQYLASRKQLDASINQLLSWSQTQAEVNSALPENIANLASKETLYQIVDCHDVAKNRLLVSHFEIDIEKQLSRYSQLAKLGPITGLVGTLIPMGPALQGLADGNIQQLSQHMQIAFTTTVIGLIIGAIGFSLYHIHKRLVVKQLAVLDFVLEKQEMANGS
ncbi:MotA/TolQ/ExbB proton channel family protein [Thalassotalea sp. 1_MG-2023]|uniref:MotA/TolQ/ExbB proton channel family protein n=1 Tax=Thalassotalea sp. 1_MG-2023 TaxID=3062680 RepID=UPI0026E38A5E|nr:MotA/TolQ/ExbB proton channel family protein [Thalassotalea sp. 1_MG-2023]MDO6426690.1 MotA/TolQ/ExbB proton channel family protein [Thalassotalea sp. 1_MG-2023]